MILTKIMNGILQSISGAQTIRGKLRYIHFYRRDEKLFFTQLCIKVHIFTLWNQETTKKDYSDQLWSKIFQKWAHNSKRMARKLLYCRYTLVAALHTTQARGRKDGNNAVCYVVCSKSITTIHCSEANHNNNSFFFALIQVLWMRILNFFLLDVIDLCPRHPKAGLTQNGQLVRLASYGLRSWSGIWNRF